MARKEFGLAGLALVSVVMSCSGPNRGAGMADVIFTGGRIWTGVEPGPSEPASAIAVGGGRVLAVGSEEDVQGFASPQTERIDLRGRLVVPGLMDAHTHFVDGGFELSGVHLRDADTPAEFARRVGAYADEHPGDWVLGGTWDHELWGGELPRRDWIDSLTAGNPVFVTRLDGHMSLANTRALELAGVTAGSEDPPGGTIVRYPDGRPTGVLKDEAQGLVSRVIPARTDAELDRSLQAAARHAVERGVTFIADMGSWAGLAAYRRALERGELPLRVYAVVPLSTRQRLSEYIAEQGRGDDRLFWGGVKAFVDGSLGSTTAWFYDPYDDEPGSTGLMVTDTAELRSAILEADGDGLQVIVHAIGDRANDWLLDVFASVGEKNGERDRRFRIEHAQHLTRAAIGRFANLGVIPSMQPYHAIDDGRWAAKRIGPQRIKTTYAFRSLLDAGAQLAFGSDWTVAPLDPLAGIYAAATRRTIDGANPDGWVPEEKITVEEALRAYTTGVARASFLEDEVGVLAPGRYADLVVLSEDILSIDPARIQDVQVDFTVVEGEIVYRRPE